MPTGNRILVAPVLAVFFVGVASVAVAIAILYHVAFEENRARLRDLVQSNVRLIEAVARYDRRFHEEHGTPFEPALATISQVVDAYSTTDGVGKTGEFTLARRVGDRIVFLLHQRYADPGQTLAVPVASDLAEPMRLALAGGSGTVIAPDYRGEMVLAAYMPLKQLNLGLVAKIDLREIRRPFIAAGLGATAIALVLAAASILLFRRVTAPLVRALVASREEAVRANSAKSHFLANVSHELRTPLNAIIGFTDLMRRQIHGPLEPPRYVEYIDDIHRSGSHLLDLINDILDMSKIEAGRYTLHPEYLEVADVAREVSALVAHRAREKSIAVKVRKADEVAKARLDRLAVRQILVNLMSNSVKFTPNGGTVEVVVAPRQDGLRIEVSDTGPGIPPEELDNVLQPFVQVNRGNGQPHEGTGLGLPLSRSLARLHGGELRLSNRPGGGLRVSVDLPLDVVSPGGEFAHQSEARIVAAT